MKSNYIKIWGLAAALSLSSCLKDLDQDPSIDPDSINASSVKTNLQYAEQSLAKVYASLALTGQKGPTDSPDIQGLDEGTTQFTRLLFYLQELPTDEAVVAWSDPGVPDFHNMNWTKSNGIIEAMYYRLAQTVSFANSFISVNQDSQFDEMKRYGVAEARFVRAYAYYYLMDLFGDTPIVTEVKDKLTESDRKSRKEVFAFIESELKAIENDLKAPKANAYGRVDRAAAWALLSRLYLNAKVYTGEERYADCMTYAKKVIDESGYTLVPNYKYLFLADNDTNGAQNENIFTVNFDGLNSKTWAGTTFLVHASIGGTMTATDYGVGSGWSGLRTTSALVDKFDGTGNPPTAWTDARAMFYTNRQSYSISSIASFTDGYAVTKYKNITSAGRKGKDPAGDFVDTDIALIRLGEVYLNYAEAALRKNTNTSDALTYVNRLRTRAGEAPLTAARLTVDEVLNERARELYWECFRRTDLIRYNRFVEGTYLWPFKGGVAAGTAVADFRKLYPIPANVVLASGGVIRQNTGY
ncbi:SusD family protein [Capnocytophaga sp. oral taxon 332 str. F0381]|uniref:RagB/SusD family nutrient uptake outer membrane protein n=1 Tax=Capnocytophaga sp. oral taxon 332 TaxID=712213 RepID=UPI0002A2F7A4|nr:RagB/SusD family nutrient uptake outer membrane protein [Capnocytophaga sp. oral taxon 332]EKY09527.1 SusD family protein [Capnocytophaga sp. oral taxon 332 str. F0381]